MATHDYVIANGTGAAVRSDLNNALAAIVSNNSSSSEPGTTYAYQWWADTNANLLKLRNSSNDGWITLRELDGTMLMEDGSAASPGLSFASDLDTGFFKGSVNELGFATGGVERLEIGSSEVVFNDPSNDVDFRVESNGNTHMLFVDAGNDRVGIGTSSPGTVLHIAEEKTGGTAELRIFNTDNTDATSQQAAVVMGPDSRSSGAKIAAIKENADFSTSAGRDISLAFLSVLNGTQTEAARINSSGRLLVGTSSARSNVLDGDGGNTLTPQFQFETANSDTAKGLSVIFGRNNTNGAEIVLGKHRSASVGGTTVVSDGDQLGSLTFSGSDGTNFIPAATIEANVDATPGSSDMPGRLVFSTTADGAGTPSERARIDSSGRLLAGTTGSSGNFRAVFQGNSGNSAAGGDVVLARGAATPANSQALGLLGFSDSTHTASGVIQCNRDGGTWSSSSKPTLMAFQTCSDGSTTPTERMRISNNGFVDIPGVYDFTTASAANVNVDSTGGMRRSTSSSKYKTNIETLSDSFSDALLACRPVWYRSTCQGDNPDHSWWGFIAEEVAEIDPRLVHWKTTEVTYNENGSVVKSPCDPEPEGVAYDRFVPHLLNLIKRQQSAIETLEAKVAALEAG